MRVRPPMRSSRRNRNTIVRFRHALQNCCFYNDVVNVFDIHGFQFASTRINIELAINICKHFCLLNPVQIGNLQESLRGEAGAAQFMPATAEMLKIRPQGYQGQFLGVDIYRSDKVVVDGGGDAHGGMWGLGCMGFKSGTMANPLGGVVT